jgi:hypothetical protein
MEKTRGLSNIVVRALHPSSLSGLLCRVDVVLTRKMLNFLEKK